MSNSNCNVSFNFDQGVLSRKYLCASAWLIEMLLEKSPLLLNDPVVLVIHCDKGVVRLVAVKKA